MILGAVLELPELLIQSVYLIFGQNRQWCLVGSCKTAPKILIFSIAMGSDYSFYMKSIASFALKVFGYIISVLASVRDVAAGLKICVCVGRRGRVVIHLLKLRGV